MIKLKNKIILLGAAIVTVGFCNMLNVTTLINETVKKQEIQAYNYTPSNILDNVFIENNTKYLPFIFKNANETISATKIKSEFTKAGLTVKAISTGNTIGTGTKITTTNNVVYNVLIYGDTNGDGIVNLIDAQKIILHKKYPTTKALTGIYFKAGNTSNKDSIINLIDAQRVIMFKKGKLSNILVEEPKSAKELDTTKPVIKLNGSATVTVQVGNSYTEQKATATDNYDGDITNKIKITSNVNTKKVGTYQVKYNVTDSNGNVANTVTRTVKVVDTTKPVIKLNGSATITIQAGNSYTEQKATATDNYDGDITSKIQITNPVNTNVPNTYTVTYKVTDNNNNTAIATRKVIVNDAIKTVEMLSQPTKQTYNYGETLQLDGAKIKITWYSNKTEQKNITSDMITNSNLSEEGQNTINVKYNGKTTSFKVLLLNKIKQIELTNNGRSDISDDYKTISTKDFILGTVQAVSQTNGSKLLLEQVQIEKVSVSSQDDSVTVNDLNVQKVVDSQGNILIKGNASKPGNYTIDIFMKYGTEKISITPQIVIQAEKSSEIGKIILEEIVADEIRCNLDSVKKALTIKNVNNEEIEIYANELSFELPTGITVKKLDAEKEEIISTEEADTIVKYIEIGTTLTTSQDISIKLSATRQNKVVDETVTFKIGAKLILSNLFVGSEQSNTQIPIGINNQDILPIYFFNQLQQSVNVQAKNVNITTESVSEANLQEGELAIILPTNKIEVILLDETENPIKYYMDGCIEISEDSNVNKIQFYISDEEVDISTLEGKTIEFIWKGQTQECKVSIKVKYETITTLDIDNTDMDNAQYDENTKYYEVNLNETFTLGSIQIGKNEGPLSVEVLNTQITTNITSLNQNTGLNIFYEKNEETGEILIKGKATAEDIYQVEFAVQINDGTSPVKVIHIKCTVSGT